MRRTVLVVLSAAAVGAALYWIRPRTSRLIGLGGEDMLVGVEVKR